MTTAPDPAALVFPVGHYMGAFHPAVAAPVKYRKVRLGVDVQQLAGDEAFGVWALAHGLPDRIADTPWTVTELIRAADEMQLPDPAGHLERLTAQGVLALVRPGTPGAVEFARSHRIQPLMMGLGNTPHDPLTFGLGVIGAAPVVKVPSSLYDVWQWGRIGRNLWETVELFAKVERDVRPDRPGVPDPEGILTRMLGELHLLLAHNAAYLDQTLPELRAAG